MRFISLILSSTLLGLIACQGDPLTFSEADKQALVARLAALDVLDFGDVMVVPPSHDSCFSYEPSRACDRAWEAADADAWQRFADFVEAAEIAAEAPAPAPCEAASAQADLESLQAQEVVTIYGLVGVGDAGGVLVVNEDDCGTLDRLAAIATATR